MNKSSLIMNQDKNTPRIVIAGTKGGAGKTIVALGITRALSNRGLKVGTFKKGPDYIDAKWLAMAARRPCHNLDPFLMDRETILESFSYRAVGKDVCIVEGNRGLFDGVDIEGTSSTAELAKLLAAPVIVVIDCTKTTRTIAAIALGLKSFDKELDLRGVILNQIGGPRHESIVTKSIRTYTGLDVLGVIPRQRKDPIPMRHLGVTPVEEHPDAENSLEQLAGIMENRVDLNAILDIASKAPQMPGPKKTAPAPLRENGCGFPKGLRIGILMDHAFQFYYPENIEAIGALGAETVFIDALSTPKLPEIDLLYIGGGFPETQAEALAKNDSFRATLKTAIEDGLPVYAECGGLMYLGDAIIFNGARYPMVGAIDFEFIIEKRPQGHGYSILKVEHPTPFYEEGVTLYGHEFHYSRPVRLKGPPKAHLACKVIRGHGIIDKGEGVTYKNVFATYTHIHALQQRDFGLRLVRAAKSFKESRVKASSTHRSDRLQSIGNREDRKNCS